MSDEQLAMRRVVAYVRDVFDDLKRVLVDDGTAWLSVGDVVAGARGGCGSSLAGVPWRIALALQRNGWVLRNAIVWSIADEMSRRTLALSSSYETLLLFAKQRKYSFDLDAVRVASRGGRAQPRNPGDVWFSSADSSPRPELPFDVASRCIAAGCPCDGVVVDPFHEAASVEFAAVQCGRRFIGISSERSDEGQRWVA
ncbi:site-specific DNA-methyltransferase [Lentzea flava]|uniref:site-specific DNA-methyltransferase n=1 Tax=Lentzea flava TaxID=103732 RepID=UPI001670B3FF|nr:site-specific DNA-methyltransferase [Lentzea flava]